MPVCRRTNVLQTHLLRQTLHRPWDKLQHSKRGGILGFCSIYIRFCVLSEVDLGGKQHVSYLHCKCECVTSFSTAQCNLTNKHKTLQAVPKKHSTTAVIKSAALQGGPMGGHGYVTNIICESVLITLHR